MLTGVGGFVLGLVFLALGLFMFLRSQKGERWGAGLSLWEGGYDRSDLVSLCFRATRGRRSR